MLELGRGYKYGIASQTTQAKVSALAGEKVVHTHVSLRDYWGPLGPIVLPGAIDI
jgi:hypothetical protein